MTSGRSRGESAPHDLRHQLHLRIVSTCAALRYVNMDKFLPSASDRSRSGTPGNGRFTAQAETAEDLLKSQTVGLVHLDDFRKRRAEALELKERGSSGASASVDGYV